MEDDGGKLFSVIFFDGEREIDVGPVTIYPSLNHKAFQSILSQKIGISPNQMSIYLADRRNPKLPYENRNKVLITGRASFERLCRERDRVILVVLKRSRRDRRRRRARHSTSNEYTEYLSGNYFSPAPGKVILLRRNQSIDSQVFAPGLVSGGGPYNYGAPAVVGPEYLEELRIQRENYLAMMMTSANSDLYGFPEEEEEEDGDFVCEVCKNAQGNNTVPFHCCVNDAVTFAFRSPAGPIGRRT